MIWHHHRRYRRTQNRQKKTRKNGEDHSRDPVRDWYDKIILAVEGIGVLAVVVTIFLTLQSSADNERDVASALKRMADMAEAMEGQRDVLVEQANSSAIMAEQTKEMVEISRRQAEAALNQSVAGIRVAEATARQADITAQELAILQQASIDMIISTRPGANGTLIATSTLRNTGTVPIRNAEFCAKSQINFAGVFERPWSNWTDCKTVTVVPGTDHVHEMVDLPVRLNWDHPTMKDQFVTHTFQLKFRDAAGKEQTIRRCVVYRGNSVIPGNVRFCPTN